MVQLFVTSKPILVHGDRVRHLTLKEHDAAAAFNSKLPKEVEVDYTDSSDSDTENPETQGEAQGWEIGADSEQDFSEYVDTPGNASAPRLMRAEARRRGVQVKDVPLPRHCHSSSRGKNRRN